MGDQANILFSQGRIQDSLRLHGEEEQICRELNNLDGLQGALGNKAVVLAELGKADEAMALYLEKEKICRQIHQVNGLVSALANQAVIQGNQRGEREKARTLVKEALQLAADAGFTGRVQQMRQFLAQLEK